MPDLNPRRTEPNAEFTYTTADGSPRNLSADADGVVWPRDGWDDEYLNSLDLPVARKAITEARAAEREAQATDAPNDKPVETPESAPVVDTPTEEPVVVAEEG